MNQVFVYGTLKRGQRNFHYLQDAEFGGEFITEAKYSMYEFDDYPAVTIDGMHAIHGEVFRVSDEQFGNLDGLERYPDFYQRIEIQTTYGLAWMYIVGVEQCAQREMIAGIWGLISFSFLSRTECCYVLRY